MGVTQNGIMCMDFVYKFIELDKNVENMSFHCLVLSTHWLINEYEQTRALKTMSNGKKV